MNARFDAIGVARLKIEIASNRVNREINLFSNRTASITSASNTSTTTKFTAIQPINCSAAHWAQLS